MYRRSNPSLPLPRVLRPAVISNCIPSFPRQPKDARNLPSYAEIQQQYTDAAWFFAFALDTHRLRQAAALVGEQCEGLDYTEFTLWVALTLHLPRSEWCALPRAWGSVSVTLVDLETMREQCKGTRVASRCCWGLFGLCLGRPQEPLLAPIKPRLPQDSVWFREQYHPTLALATTTRERGPFTPRKA